MRGRGACSALGWGGANALSPLSARQKLCSRKKGGKKPSGKQRSSQLRERKRSQEDDHECIRPIIRLLEPTSQGTVSEIALLSTGSHRRMCASNFGNSSLTCRLQ